MEHHHHHHHGGGQEYPGGGYPGGGSGYPAYPQGGGGGYPQGGGFQRREFYIVSDMSQRVVDVKKASTGAGASVIIYKRKAEKTPNQLWYTDPNGYIRSVLNDMTMHNPTKGHGLVTEMPSNDPRSQWRVDGDKIVNNAGECLDVKGAHDSDGSEVCAWDFKNQKNQRWHIEYVS